MASCPQCRLELAASRSERGIFWHCSRCDGRAVGVALLRRLVTQAYVNALWVQAVESAPGNRPCPFCERSMIPTGSLRAEAGQLDVCTRCQVVWFDGREFERAPALPQPAKQALSQEALEALGRFEAAEIAASLRFAGEDIPSSEESLLAATAVLGLPVEEEQGFLKRNPWVSWGVAAAITAVGVLGLFRPELVRQFGLISSEPFRLGALTFVTSLFLHAGELQLLASVYFLALFGDNVEDFLGSGNYALLLFVAGIAGSALHVLFTDNAVRPAVGAGPAIAGIVIFYALQFPHAKIRYFHTLRRHSMPASGALIFWLATQVVSTRPAFLRTGTSSVWLYLGGAAAGALFWFLFREERYAR